MSLISLIAVLVLGSTQTPPPIVETRQPDSGGIDAVWDCRGREVRYRIETDGARVRIMSYSGAGGAASAETLDRWNATLEPMWMITEAAFTCNRNTDRLSIGGPRKGGGAGVSVVATWRDGRLELTGG